ncbi:hypothetical protein B1A99_26725 [Cohnella sp. CIP 111063]|uniref:restriction endonuclease n=1 Tax=unclassified Cohnella TaxID=2636738 RepID=UPI000B8C2E28|nr:MULTISPECIES: restriction endonuclease [unclassified Cohnella]OXS54542.1 hypothetical protein B1A99_26725 [Cohnella sp. CIP 111063]PRX64050.1 hypothetical protein B0G52_120145 [Cohnella sp. SGD-V74]
MPVLQAMELPKPSDWQEFERIIKQYARLRWKGLDVATFGSNGQTQHGVDLYIKTDVNEIVGIQCKKTINDSLPFKVVEKEIKKAENFKPVLKHYYIATTAKRDARTQEQINLLNQQRIADGVFGIDVLFWEDVAELLLTSPKTLEQLYPQLFIPKPKQPSNKAATKNKKQFLEGTIGNDTYQRGYVNHLIKRYQDYKRADYANQKENMKYAIIHEAIRREIKYKWDEAPTELFEKLCAFLQKRIDTTIVGKLNKKKGIKNYSSFDEFKAFSSQ